jgi:hypothetical protein
MFDPVGRPDNQESDKTDQYQIKHGGGVSVKKTTLMVTV